MNKVELLMTRYALDSSFLGKKGSITENQRKKRKAFLEKIDMYVKTIDFRERILMKLMSWLEEWNFVLSEVAEIDIEEYHHWVAQMERMPEGLKAIDSNVNNLCQITMALFEERKRQKRKLLARGTLWKAWKERVVKRPATAHALRPDQMIFDQLALNTKVSEIQDMLQELINTAMFSKLENNAIKYISATVLNLSTALNTVNEEMKLLSSHITNVAVGEEQEQEIEKGVLQKAFQELSEENDMLQQKLKEAEEKCDQLIRIKNFLGRQLLPPTTPLRALSATSPQPPVGKDSEPEDIDDLLSKELEKTMDEPKKKGTRATTVKWDSTMEYIAQDEPAPATAKPQTEDKAHHDQKNQLLPSPQPDESSDTNLDKEEKRTLEMKSSQFSDSQALDQRRKDRKSKGPEVRARTSGMWPKRGRSEHSVGRSPISEAKIEPTVRPIEKEAKTQVELPKTTQPESTPEPYKTESKGKKYVPGKVEEMPGTTKQRGKLSPRVPKQTSVSPDDKSEQSDLESFQRAILAFLREKMSNVGKAIDPKSIQEEEELLGRAEVENLNTIKEKMEEYFQKVAEAVTKTLRTYKDAKRGQFREISGKRKLSSVTPHLFPKRASISTKPEISNLSEVTDPVIRKLVQALLDELESDRDRVKDERQEQQKQEEEAWREEQRLQKLEEWRQAQELWIREETDRERLKAMREAEDGQRPKGSKSKQLVKTESKPYDLKMTFTQSAVVLTPRWMKVLKPQISQVQLFQVDPYEMESFDEKQAASSRTLLVSAKPLPKPVPEQAQIRGPEVSQMSMASLTLEQIQALRGPLIHEHGTEEQKLGTQLKDSKIFEQTVTPRRSLTSEKPEAMQIPQTTAEQVQISGATVTQKTVLPLQQIQVKDITLTSQQVLDQGITPTPEPVKEPRIMLNPQQAQALGITLAPEQAKARKISLTPQQAQALGITLTPEQTKEQRISLTPQQAQDLGLTLTPQQAQALGLTLTPEQAKAQRVSLIPQQAQVPGVSLTPQQAQVQGISLTPQQGWALGMALTPEQAQAQGIILTPEQAQALGLTLTPQQVKTQRVSLTPEQAQALGIALTPDQDEALGMTLTPKQAQALGITLTPEQAKAMKINLTPYQVQALGITLTLEQTRAQRVSLTPQQAEALGITLSPEQAQALGIAPTPQQTEALGIYLTPQQAQALGITLTPEQAKATKINLTPYQMQTLGITLTLEQARAQRVSLTPQQAEALGITLSPEQAQALGIAPTPLQTEALGVTLSPGPGKEQRVSLTPEQVEALGMTLTPKQAQPHEISLSPEEAQALGLTLTPQQAEALGITLSPEQAQALGIAPTPQQTEALGIYLIPQQAQALGITLTPEQAEALGITLSPEQAQALGIAPAPQQTEALGVTLSPEPGKEQRVSLTPEQVEALGMTPTPKQAQPHEISLSPEEAQALGLTLTPQQALIKKIYLTPQQAQALGITLTPEQAKAMKINLTPYQAQALGLTLTPQQALIKKIYLTPQQAQALGITLTPEQAKATKINLTPYQVQALGITLTLEQTQAQRVSLTLQQAEALGITLSPEQAQALGIAPTPQQTEALGITLSPGPGKEQRVSLTPEQVEALGMTLTPKQAQPHEISLSSEEAQALGLTLTPQQALIKKIYLTPQQAQALGITLTPEQAKATKINLTPYQVQALGITLTVEQTRAQRVSLTPQQAEALGITLSREQAQALGIAPAPQQTEALGVTLSPEPGKEQRVSLTPEQVEALGMTPTPKQAQPHEISLSPEEAQALGLTLTPQQALIKKIYLTPQQAQALGITLTPEQAKAMKINLTPYQVQALGITLTLEQTRAQRVSLTPQQAEALGITLSPEQAQALGIAPIPQQAESLTITLTPEQDQALEISPTPEQTPHTLEFSLSPQQAWDLGITLTPRQVKVQKICLTPEQAQVLGVTFTSEQVKAWKISVTPEQAQALGITLTPEQAKVQSIRLTLEQAEALGITLTPEQAEALGIISTPSQLQKRDSLPSKKLQDLDASLTYEQAELLRGGPIKESFQTQKTPIIPESMQTPKPTVASKQTQTIEIPQTMQWSQIFGFPFPQRPGKALGITLTPGQTQASEQVQALQPPLTQIQTLPLGQLGPGETQTLIFTITLEKAQNFGVTFTQEQIQAAAITLTCEQVAALENALTAELAWKWGRLTTPENVQEASPRIVDYQPTQAFQIPLTLEKPETLAPADRLFQQLKDFPPSIPLQKVRPFSHAPLSPRMIPGMSILPDSEKLEEAGISPTYKRIPANRGQVTPIQLPTPEVPPTPRQLPTPGAPSTPGPPLGPWHLFKPEDTWPPLIPGTLSSHRKPTPPPVSGVPHTSGEFPGLLVSGGSTVPREFLISRTFPFQPPVMQTYSTPEQQRPSLTIPEQKEFPSRATPILAHLSTAEAQPVPGRPQRISSSSVSQKRSGAVSLPKPELASIHPNAVLAFEVPQAPLPMEKLRVSKVSDTSEKTRVLQGSSGMKPHGMFQPYVTGSRIPGSKSHLIGEKVPSGLEKPITPLPSLTIQLSQTSQNLSFESGQKPQFPPIDVPWILTPVSGTRKAKTMESPLTAQHPEDRYVVDVEAQRKNLVILNQAVQTARLPAQYHTIARNLIIESLHMNTVRLGYLFRKYVAYRLIQLARNNLTKRLKNIQNTGKGYETQNLYVMLDRLDNYRKKVMWLWSDKQKQLEQRRKECLRSMTQFFSEFEKVFKVNLSHPTPVVSSFKKIPDFTKFQRPGLELLVEDSKKPDIFKTFGQEAQTEAIWNADLSTSSYPITEKKSLNTLWAQLGGYPDIPRLLQLDIQWTFRKSLASIRSQCKKIPK
ncbi:protein FAM186A [Mesocricetus auratus]|uniref:Protein FAM186A n=1 Tax=Mesocricetus auratus TaxID=10036 RepID=A0ABM2Y4X4_MESAU|nr:protein FAM186A [Mesocricetus auratus]